MIEQREIPLKPFVAVWMVTYNHSKYIGQAIESILNQQTNFPLKLFIGEDCSKDNTREICLQYQTKFPDSVQVIPTEKNDIAQNCRNVWTACSESGARYVAICEGDDYWTDMGKLQKQVDFLDNNPDFAICFTGIEVKDEMGWELPYENYFPLLTKDVFTIDDFLMSGMHIVPSATAVYRNNLSMPLPDFYYTSKSGDICILLLMADKGKAKYLPEKTAVYRNHAGGITKTKENLEKGHAALMKLFHDLQVHFAPRHTSVFRKRFFDETKGLLISGAKGKKGLSRLKHYFKYIGEYLKYSDKFDAKEFIYYHLVIFFPFVLKGMKKRKVA